MKTKFAVAFMLMSVTAFAAPRVHTYPLPCAKVWDAITSIPTGPGHPYSSSIFDDKRMKAEFVTGHGAWTGKRTLYVSLSGKEESCDVAMEGVFSGLAHDDKGDLFKRIEEQLKNPEKSPPAK